ncbi:hypothetical protein [Paraburkholderia xenovorans]|uniref:hypothetical protein n=1 Tax=Paraburkholderia xenovorans TaxID=36873 RepID=UPI0038BB776C
MKIDSVPRNQFGDASRQAICSQLGISRSSCQSNSEINKLFEELDIKLGKHPRGNKVVTKRDSEQREVDSATLGEIERLQNKNEELSGRLARLSYLENTGWELLP